MTGALSDGHPYADQSVTACPLCGDEAHVVLRDHHGYAAPHRFDVVECSACEASSARPLRCDNSVYEQIYRAAEHVPGYDRYRRLQRLAQQSQNPLAEMAATEDVYWGVAEALGRVAPAGSRVLEVGSGLGYLVHAMRQAGLDAQGIDVSATAVQSACATFGNHFRASTVQDLGAEPGSFDCIVATELLEHLEDPQEFVDSAMRLLRPGGHLILTTPNKDLYPRSWAWHTDLAPVHLWWFRRASLRRLAWQAGASVRFVDFSAFYRVRPAPVLPTKPQTFDASGAVVFRDSILNTAARAVLVRWPSSASWIGRTFLRRVAARRAAEEAGRQGLSHCAIFKAQP